MVLARVDDAGAIEIRGVLVDESGRLVAEQQ
jgi:hypothetical protein